MAQNKESVPKLLRFYERPAIQAVHVHGAWTIPPGVDSCGQSSKPNSGYGMNAVDILFPLFLTDSGVRVVNYVALCHTTEG